MGISEWWRSFRSWSIWTQVLVWIFLWPLPLLLLALARPRSRPLWGAIAALGALVWASVLLSALDDGSTVEAVPAEQTTTTAAPPTTSELDRTTTTEPDPLGAIPDPDTPLAEYSIAPVFTGGLTTAGAGVFSVDDLLDGLIISPAGSIGGYERDLFEHWIDGDGNGCDTREEVLRAESYTPAQVDPAGCHVITGDWRSIYDGVSSDDPTELEVDHLVALAEAWRSGASTWSPERRRAFANDLAHPGALAVVTAAVNGSKGDSDPAAWQPPNRAAWCMYAADWITVKARWSLTADHEEVAALRDMLRGCGHPPTTTTTTTSPPPPPQPTTLAPVPLAPPTTSRGACDASYPGACIPPAPPDLDCGDVAYDDFQVRPPDPHGFDGDNDGVGCES